MLAVALSACSSGTAPTGGTNPSSTSTPSPTASAGARAHTDASTPADQAGALDATPAPEPPPPGEAPITAAPTAGLYRYAQEGRGVFGDYPAEGTLRVRAATLATNGQRQRQVRTVSDEQITENTFVFTDAGVLLEEITQRVGSGSFAQTFTCTLTPALQLVRLPLQVGASWKGASTCQGLDVTFRASFLREDRLTVARTTVDTIVMKATYEAEGDGIEQTTVTTSWISPDHRLIVRSTEETTGRQGAIEFSSSLTETILNLKPE